MQGVVPAISELGCLAGALFILACGDWLGRRWSIMLGATVMILGVILQVTAYPGHVPLAQFCIGRVITGIGNGMNTSNIPTYQAECSRTSNRGLLICIEGGTVAIGTLISYWVDFGASSGQAGKSTPMSAVFTGGKTQHCRRMLLGASSQFFQQIGGCNAVIYYLPVLFEKSLGQTPFMSMILGGVNMVVYSVLATTSWFLIERVGRRKLFLVGSFGQSLSMVIAFACLIPDNEQAAKGAAVGLFTFIATFGTAWLPLPWLYPAEISPIKTRAKANAISTCTNWLFNFLIVMVTPIMIRDIGWGTYLFFAVINALFIPVIYLFYPETAGRSLEEIDLIFAKGYLENMGYVRAAKELPRLSDEEIKRVAIQYGFGSADQEAKHVVGDSDSTESNVVGTGDGENNYDA
ncbi:sugar transporter STL1 [Aspergillus lentulus]|nr:hypothetical protein CNMCM6069_002753 [Aspergillus lentulus]GFG17456.1 sugar transporter STL1 [Aspergillus lentulus]